jgi:hypothetical protein
LPSWPSSDIARRRNSPSWFVGDGAVVGEGRGKWRKRGGEIYVRVLREERKTEMNKGEGGGESSGVIFDLFF